MQVNTWMVVVTVSSGSPMTYTVKSTTLGAQPTNSGTNDNAVCFDMLLGYMQSLKAPQLEKLIMPNIMFSLVYRE